MEMSLCNKLEAAIWVVDKLIDHSYDDGQSLLPTNPVIKRIICK
jgi:hypothetical protein